MLVKSSLAALALCLVATCVQAAPAGRRRNGRPPIDQLDDWRGARYLNAATIDSANRVKHQTRIGAANGLGVFETLASEANITAANSANAASTADHLASRAVGRRMSRNPTNAGMASSTPMNTKR